MKAPAIGAGRTKRKKRAPDPKLEEHDEAVSVSGGLFADLVAIRASNVNLVATFGNAQDGRDVLVPLVNWQLFGGKVAAVDETANASAPELSSHLLALDNLAFLLQDVGYDMREAVRLLVQSKGGVPLQEGRMRYTARMLRLASKHISAAAEQLQGNDERID